MYEDEWEDNDCREMVQQKTGQQDFWGPAKPIEVSNEVDLGTRYPRGRPMVRGAAVYQALGHHGGKAAVRRK